MIHLITEPQNHMNYKKTLNYMNCNLMNMIDTSCLSSCKRFEKGKFGNFHLTSHCTLRCKQNMMNSKRKLHSFVYSLLDRPKE